MTPLPSLLRLLANCALSVVLWAVAAAGARADESLLHRPEPYEPPLTRPEPLPTRRPQVWVAPLELAPPSRPQASAVPVAPGPLRTPEPLVAEHPPAGAPAFTSNGVMVWQPSGPDGRKPAAAPVSPGGNVTYNLMVVGQNGQPVALKLNQAGGTNQLELSLGGGQPAYYVAPSAPGAAPSAFLPAPASTVYRYAPRRSVGLQTQLAFVSESATGLDMVPGAVARPGLTGHWDFDGRFYAAGAFSYHAFTLVDQQFSASQHRRDEFWLDLDGGMYLLEQGPLRVAGELGYRARQVSNGSTMPPPLTTPYVSAPDHLFHGPALGGRLEYLVDPALRFDLSARVAPYLLASGDTAVLATTPAFAYGAQAGFSWRLFSFLTLDGGYRVDGQNGAAGYSSLVHGPTLGLAGRF